MQPTDSPLDVAGQKSSTFPDAKEEPLEVHHSPEAPSQNREIPGPPNRLPRTFYVSGFWQRALAGGIDLALIVPVSLLLCNIAARITGLTLPKSRVRGLDFWIDRLLANDFALLSALALTLSIACLYSFIFQVSIGRTLGMRALKLRIIDSYGDRPTVFRAAVRTTGYLLSVVSMGLGFIWIAFDSENRGLHDWVAGTHVVKTKT